MRHYPPRPPIPANATSWNHRRDRTRQRAFRKMLIARDGLRCWQCGKPATPADPLQAHHTSPSDGRILCREHHKETDLNAR